MASLITIVDYGLGNLLSVARAFEYCGGEVVLTGQKEDIEEAERLVLPGVGAFVDGMQGLRDLGLVEPIKEYAASGRPFLGICLGMQMMFNASEEFGEHEGLGLIPGRVLAVSPIGVDGRPHKIPHIGWNSLHAPAAVDASWEDTVLAGLEPGYSVYFVHSYAAVPAIPAHCLAVCYYDGIVISSVVRDGALHGCQFHPEKSGQAGLRIIRNFIEFSQR